MIPTAQSWLVFLPRMYGAVAAGAAIGLAAWFAAARRRATTTLFMGRRMILFSLLSVLLFAWWHILRLEPQWQIQSVQKSAASVFSQNIASRLSIAPPVAASFAVPEIRTVDHREVLLLSPPAQLEWKLDGNTHTVTLAFGFDPPAYERGTTNGADVILEISDKNGRREVYHRFLNPIHHPADRGLQRETVALPLYKPGTRLVLRTDPGPNGDTAWDWVYLAEFHVRPRVATP